MNIKLNNFNRRLSRVARAGRSCMGGVVVAVSAQYSINIYGAVQWMPSLSLFVLGVLLELLWKQLFCETSVTSVASPCICLVIAAYIAT